MHGIEFPSPQRNDVARNKRHHFVSHFPPLVLVIADPLGRADGQYYFWLYDDKVSVITTRDWEGTSTPTLYEYLAHALVLQGVLIHLDVHCGGKHVRDPDTPGVIYGNVFEYYPRRKVAQTTSRIPTTIPRSAPGKVRA